MKNLLIMRHAKSDWDSDSLTDFDRPLNSRGKIAAPLMGNELLKLNKVPDLIISSPALRAKSTAELVSKSFTMQKPIQLEREFYFGSIDEIIKIVRRTNLDSERIMIVGHNPTFEYLISELIIGNQTCTMPTAAIASILFDSDQWNKITRKTGTLEWLITPKDL